MWGTSYIGSSYWTWPGGKVAGVGRLSDLFKI